jgi:hypothetical protein
MPSMPRDAGRRWPDHVHTAGKVYRFREKKSFDALIG